MDVSDSNILIAIFTGLAALFAAKSRWPSIDATKFKIKPETDSSWEGENVESRSWIISFDVTASAPALLKEINIYVFDLNEKSLEYSNSPEILIGLNFPPRLTIRLSNLSYSKNNQIIIEMMLRYRFFMIPLRRKISAMIDNTDKDNPRIIRNPGRYDEDFLTDTLSE